MTEFDARAAEIAARYQAAGRFAAGFVSGKLRGDPIHRFVAERAGRPDTAVDVGCGWGQVSILLALGGAGQVVGIDWDGRKIAAARRAGEGLAVRFEEADLSADPIPGADLVLLADVLHYMRPAAQDDLLARAAGALRPGGRIWVREMVRGHGLRSLVGIGSERLLATFSWNRATTLEFRDTTAIVGPLERAGITCEVHAMWAGTPYANVLVAGERRSAKT